MIGALYLSIVVPIFNGNRYIENLYRELKKEFNGYVGRYEIIFIDDASTDDTAALLEDIYARDSCLRIVKFKKNRGQHNAIYTGLKISGGNVIIVLDDDMAFSVKSLSLFVGEIEKGKDVVLGWRLQRGSMSIFRKGMSFITNLIISFFVGVRIHDPGCGVKCFRKEIIDIEGNHLRVIKNLFKYQCKELKIKCNNFSYSRYNSFKLIKLFYVVIMNIFVMNTLVYDEDNIIFFK